MAAAELDVHRGRMPDRPFVLLGQQYLCDPQRSSGDIHPIWAYAHVPNGFTGDATDAILGQIERFAPGFRERIVAQQVIDPLGFEQYNPNYVDGDIATGANGLRQLILRPRVSLDPYATGIPGVYLCSAVTPPGAGVHGMCGNHAARRALRDLENGRPRLSTARRRPSTQLAGVSGGQLDAAEDRRAERLLAPGRGGVAHRVVDRPSTLERAAPGDRMVGPHLTHERVVGALVHGGEHVHVATRVLVEAVPLVAADHPRPHAAHGGRARVLDDDHCGFPRHDADRRPRVSASAGASASGPL